MAEDDIDLAMVLREFARTLTTDFPIQGILDHLVRRIVEVMPVTGAGVTLISSDLSPQYVSASDEAAMGFERLQSSTGQGPCLLAYQSGEGVEVPDLSVDDRFPLFSPTALSTGLAAVFTFPLRHADGCMGALDLYRDTTGPLNAHQTATAETMADVVAACLINAQAREDADVASAAHLHNSLHDPLTGLPNRVLLMRRMRQAQERAHRARGTTAVYFVDLDRFKLVNDHHGHHVGDELLISVAERFVRLLRAGDVVARISGDEFVFLCEGITDEVDTDIIASLIDAAFARPFIVDGLRLSVSASVGMAIAGPGEDIDDQLLVRADTAMYLIKRHRVGRRHVADRRDSGPRSAPPNLEEDLLTALQTDTLAIAYQPIVQTSDSTIIQVEALLRWEHPSRGCIDPLLMIGTAERSPLINLIGEWVLEQSCLARAGWPVDDARAPIGLAVNVSARQLVSGDFFKTVERALTVAEFDPNLLVLEMTENLLIEDSARAMEVLHGVRHLGVRIAVDDFGTGYSSLSYLARLPIDIVKIDKSLIGGVATGPEAVVVSAVTRLAHELGMVVVAEGVENEEQHNEIVRIGCDHSQGFYFAMPMSGTSIDALDWAAPLRDVQDSRGAASIHVSATDDCAIIDLSTELVT